MSNPLIYESKTLGGTVSNEYGFYSLTLPAGITEIQYSVVGYEKQVVQIDLKKDTAMNIALKLLGELDEITVQGNTSKVESAQMSTIEIPTERLQKIPVLLGEPDVL